MKPEINLPRVYSGKISLGKTMFPRGKVRNVTGRRCIPYSSQILRLLPIQKMTNEIQITASKQANKKLPSTIDPVLGSSPF